MQSTFRYDVHAGNAGDTIATAGTMIFEWTEAAGTVEGVTRIVEMSVWDNPAEMRMSYDGTIWGPFVELDQDDPPIQIPHAARAVQIRNKTPGSVSRYQIIGFW